MIVQMVYQMSGGRYDDRRWPVPWTDFEVPDDEGHGLVRCGAAMEVVGTVVPVAAKSVPAAASVAVPAAEPDAPVVPAAPAEEIVAELFSEPAAPRPSDPKQDWVEYAVSRGAPRSEAENQTKVQLQIAYGGRL